ncbi:MAG TPA: tyrosine-type recombinase/integrase [Stellaceae bacterium]|nr:tyrosine-type recombinase/integrase [Stellaceae bacterium]
MRKAVGRQRFYENLRTGDLGQARIKAAVCEAQWLAAIERARRGTDITEETAFWRQRLRDCKTDEERDWLQERILDAGSKHAGMDWHEADEPGNEAGRDALDRFVSMAMGGLVPFAEHLDEYLATVSGGIEAKSLHMKRTNLVRFGKLFEHTADVERTAVQRWANAEVGNGAARATVLRAIGDLRGYWKFLVSVNAAREHPDPLDKLSIASANSSKSSKADARKAFTAADVRNLLAEARKHGDDELSDLIELGMWTGARREELCALRVEKVDLKAGYFEVEDAKTEAGWRQVPIHSKLAPKMRRLVKASTDGYVLSGLPANKYGVRGGAVGKRFARLRQSLGFGPQHVFHSVRKTVATLLEDAGVPENVAADILGHEKKTMTYGLYSGGTSLKTKRAAIEKLDYGRDRGGLQAGRRR